MDKVRYIGPSPEEDKAGWRVERYPSGNLKSVRYRFPKLVGNLIGAGCLGLFVLAALTALGALWKVFTWVWGL